MSDRCLLCRVREWGGVREGQVGERLLAGGDTEPSRLRIVGGRQAGSGVVASPSRPRLPTPLLHTLTPLVSPHPPPHTQRGRRPAPVGRRVGRRRVERGEFGVEWKRRTPPPTLDSTQAAFARTLVGCTARNALQKDKHTTPTPTHPHPTPLTHTTQALVNDAAAEAGYAPPSSEDDDDDAFDEEELDAAVLAGAAADVAGAAATAADVAGAAATAAAVAVDAAAAVAEEAFAAAQAAAKRPPPRPGAPAHAAAASAAERGRARRAARAAARSARRRARHVGVGGGGAALAAQAGAG